jgi:hypothetical protein
VSVPIVKLALIAALAAAIPVQARQSPLSSGISPLAEPPRHPPLPEGLSGPDPIVDDFARDRAAANRGWADDGVPGVSSLWGRTLGDEQGDALSRATERQGQRQGQWQGR